MAGAGFSVVPSAGFVSCFAGSFGFGWMTPEMRPSPDVAGGHVPRPANAPVAELYVRKLPRADSVERADDLHAAV